MQVRLEPSIPGPICLGGLGPWLDWADRSVAWGRPCFLTDRKSQGLPFSFAVSVVFPEIQSLRHTHGFSNSFFLLKILNHYKNTERSHELMSGLSLATGCQISISLLCLRISVLLLCGRGLCFPALLTWNLPLPDQALHIAVTE